MAVTTISPRIRQLRRVLNRLDFYQSGALTVTENLFNWVIPYYCYIYDIIAVSQTAGSGGTSDILDIEYSTDNAQTWTSLWATAANRPTLLVGNTGMFTWTPEVFPVMLPGYVLSLNVDQVDTTGSAKFSCYIMLGDR